MKFNFNIKKIGLLLAIICLTGGAVFTFSSCNQTLDVKPTSEAGEQGRWKSIDDVRSSLIGIYGLFRAALASNDAYWLRGELRRGDFTAYDRPDLKAIIKGDLNASYPVIEDITDWRRFYAVINACNSFIVHSGKALQDRRYSKLNNKVDIAQARALRAFAYFLMVRIWGDVPLITELPGGDFKKIPRTPKEQVLGFAENELREVAPILPYVYGADDPQMPGNYFGFSHGRYVNTLITKLAAYAMLAHIAAWQGHYMDVAVYTKFILDHRDEEGLSYVNINQLTAQDGLFANSKNNQLIGFNFVEGHGELTTTGHIEDLTLAAPFITRRKPQIYVTKDSISAIFPVSNGNDNRFGIDTISGLPRKAYFTNYRGEIPIFSKIKVLRGGRATTSFAKYSSVLIFTRLEEITLLRAEALAVLNKEDNEDGNQGAIALLNIIKTNKDHGREIDAYPNPKNPEDLITAIFQERRRELMGEGWRWWDQVRYNRIKRNNPEFNQLLDQDGEYWPISKKVLKRNHKIIQNAYWAGK